MDMEDSIEVSCIGSFQLGMLYNCNTNQLVGETSLWDESSIKLATERVPQAKHVECKVLKESTMSAKAELLGISPNFLLCVIEGKVSLEGAAKFLTAVLTTGKVQRVALFLQCMFHSDYLSVKKMGDFPVLDMEKKSEATHIITGITFGVSAFMVFDKECQKVLDSKAVNEVKSRMEALIKTILEKDATGVEKAEVNEMKCTMFCSEAAWKNPKTWDEAVNVYEELTKSCILVPLKANLEPLSRYCNEPVNKPLGLISSRVTKDFFTTLECVEVAKLESLCMLESQSVCSDFEGMGKQLKCFQVLLDTYKEKMVKLLREVLPKVRTGTLTEDAISDFLSHTNSSSFSPTKLRSWVGEKKEEVSRISSMLQFLEDIEHVFTLETHEDVIHSPAYDNVLCLNIAIHDQDPFLLGLSDHLSGRLSTREAKIPWYMDKEELRYTKDMTRLFKGFAIANRKRQDLKHIVSNQSVSSEHCVEIFCYELGYRRSFTPPGPPSELQSLRLSFDSVQLKWKEASMGAASVKTYCVSYRQSESGGKWHEFCTADASQSLTIGSLQPATLYEFKIKGVCPEGCSEDSGIHCVKTLQELKKLSKPNVSSVTATSAQLTWEYCEEGVQYYSILCQKPFASDTEWTDCKTIVNSVVITGLSPSTTYAFKVEALFKNGSRAMSEASENSQTLRVYLQKPIAVQSTEFSASLQWFPPQNTTESVQGYALLFCLCSELPSGWKTSIAGIQATEAEVKELQPGSKYVFKVVASFSSQPDVESEHSAEVCTQVVRPPEFTKPTISQVSESGLVLEWKKPRGAEVENYQLFQKCISENTSDWHPCGTAKGNEEKFAVSSLGYNKEYVFKVTASCLHTAVDIESQVSNSCTLGKKVSFDPPVVETVQDQATTLKPSQPSGTVNDIEKYTHKRTEYRSVKICKPKFSCVTSNSVSLTWSNPAGYNVSHYSICKKEAAGEWCSYGEAGGAEEMAHITGLSPHTIYTFKIIGIMSGQQVTESEESDECKTKMQFKKPLVSNVTGSTVSLKWAKPLDVKEKVQKYAVYSNLLHTSSEDWIPTKESIDGEVTSTVLELKHNSCYLFRLEAFLSSGETVMSDISDETHTQPKPSMPMPVVSNVTDSSVLVKWSKLTEIPVNYYKVTYNSSSMPSQKFCGSTDPDVCEITAQNLDPDMEYVFKVSAVYDNTMVLDSEISEPVKTKCSLSFGKPIVRKENENSFVLQWSKPVGSRVGVIKHYSILSTRCVDTEDLETWTENVKVVDSLDSQEVIAGLSSNSTYFFKIRAHLENGEIIESEPSEFVQTAKVTELQPPVVRDVTSSSVSLHWSKPEGVDIDHFTIWSRNLTLDSKKWIVSGTCSGSKDEIGIECLNPNTRYEFYLSALPHEDKKMIESTSSGVVTTKKTVHFSKPSILNITSCTVTLSWHEPEEVPHSITKYAVEYCLCSSSEKVWKAYKDDSRHSKDQFTVTDLCARSTYIFRIRAHLDSGKSIESEESKQISTKDYFLKKPATSNVTESSVQLHWSRPEETVAEKYTVWFQPSSFSTASWQCHEDLDADQGNQITIDQLQPGEGYKFKVVAHCENNVEVESDVSHCKTRLEPELSKPECVTAKEHCVTLKWKQPAEYNAEIIEQYFIAHYPSSEPDNVSHEPLPLRSEFPITGHIPYTWYSFNIVVSLKSGRTLQGPPTRIRTEAPSKLTLPKILSVTDHSVCLKWTKPEGVEVTKYQALSSEHGNWMRTIRRRLVGPTWKVIDEVNGAREEFVYKFLKPDTRYEFKVVAIYDGGKTIESEGVPCDTKHRIVFEPPTSMQVTDYSVSLEWNKPDRLEGQMLERYTITYCEAAYSKETSKSTDTMQPNATLFDLRPNTDYSFHVTALLGSGHTVEGEKSVIVRTKPRCIPGLGRVDENSITDDSIRLSWDKPSSCGHTVHSYTVMYWKDNEHSHGECEMVNTTRTDTVVVGLEPQTRYIFKIRANRKQGESYESGTVTCQTLPECGIVDLIWEASTDHTAHLTWSKVDTAAQIDHFEISYRRSGAHGQRQAKYVNTRTASSKEMTIQLTDLLPSTNYECIVSAVLHSGRIGKKDGKLSFETELPCRPGKPVSSAVTNNCIKLQWSKPSYHCQRVRGYVVIYHQAGNSNEIEEMEIKSVTEEATIENLSSNVNYGFKVKPVTDDPNLGMVSENSDLVLTKPECQAGQPEIVMIRDTSVELKWKAPEHDAKEVEYYQIFYCSTTSSNENWKPFKQLVYAQQGVRTVMVSELRPRTEYKFKVCITSNGTLPCVDSECSDPITTKAEPPAKKLKSLCTRVSDKHKVPAIYQLPLQSVPFRWSDKVKKYDIGEQDKGYCGRGKVLMLMGQTGSGKTTLVNGMTNFILGVTWKDDFRFQLIGNEGVSKRSSSQTQSITAYTFHRMEGSQVDYTLTIIDTPGFGDTDGLHKDKSMIDEIESFFSKEGGITFLTGIGFVAQAGQTRLTATQKYIYNSVLGIFGKNFVHNISVMATFSDGAVPPLFETLEDADLKFERKYMFNNSALYAGQESPHGPFFFGLGARSFSDFFSYFKNAEDVSLMLTKEVLVERKQLEVTLEDLQTKIQFELSKMDELRQMEQAIALKKESFMVTRPVFEKVSVEPGKYTTTCLTCHRTCHEVCVYSNNDDKYMCWAMDGRGKADSSCRICKGNCHWSVHQNTDYKIVITEKKVKVSYEEVKRECQVAADDVLASEKVLERLKHEHERRKKQAQELVKTVKKCIDRLQQIALRPSLLTEEDYIDLLIDTEKREKKPRWKERVESYEMLKGRIDLVGKIQQGEDESLFGMNT